MVGREWPQLAASTGIQLPAGPESVACDVRLRSAVGTAPLYANRHTLHNDRARNGTLRGRSRSHWRLPAGDFQAVPPGSLRMVQGAVGHDRGGLGHRCSAPTVRPCTQPHRHRQLHLQLRSIEASDPSSPFRPPRSDISGLLHETGSAGGKIAGVRA